MAGRYIPDIREGGQKVEWTIAGAWKWVLGAALFVVFLWYITKGRGFWSSLGNAFKKLFGR